VLTFAVVALGVCCYAAVDNRPIVGVLTLPCDDPSCGKHTEYFPASYVKAVESGGGRVVPIHFTWSASQIQALLPNLNGAFYTGGGASLDDGSQYYAAVQAIYQYVITANSNGDFFPLWGTCLGFQAICRAASNDPTILQTFDSENYTIPLNFTPMAAHSRIFDEHRFPGSGNVMNLLSTLPITMNNHMEGVTPTDFASHPQLNSVFDVLATNVDRNGKAFVSLIEAKQLPIYGAQFHQEKPQFEWWPEEVIQHTLSAVVANSHFATFFVDEARKCNHSFPANVQPDLIYNYSPYFTNGEFTQEYMW